MDLGKLKLNELRQMEDYRVVISFRGFFPNVFYAVLNQ